jgi:hypothetical protein
MSEILRQAFASMIRECILLEIEWEGDVVTMRGGECKTVMPSWFHQQSGAEPTEQRLRQALMHVLIDWVDMLYTDHDNLAQKVYDRFREDDDVRVIMQVQGISSNRCWCKATIMKRREGDGPSTVSVVMPERFGEIEQLQRCESMADAIHIALSHVERSDGTIDISAPLANE